MSLSPVEPIVASTAGEFRQEAMDLLVALRDDHRMGQRRLSGRGDGRGALARCLGRGGR
jgi:hypothetical protein